MAGRKRKTSTVEELDPETIRLFADLTEQLGNQHLHYGDRVKAARAFAAAAALRAMLRGGKGGTSNDPRWIDIGSTQSRDVPRRRFARRR